MNTYKGKMMFEYVLNGMIICFVMGFVIGALVCMAWYENGPLCEEDKGTPIPGDPDEIGEILKQPWIEGDGFPIRSVDPLCEKDEENDVNK